MYVRDYNNVHFESFIICKVKKKSMWKKIPLDRLPTVVCNARDTISNTFIYVCHKCL